MSIAQHIEKHLGQAIKSQQAVGTGLFSAYKVTLENDSKIFIKYQHKATQQLILEGKSLELLGETIHTPKLLGSCEHCLILEWIKSTHNQNLQTQMGIELAKLHQNTNNYFGFEFDNNIGRTPQPNAVGKNIIDWATFFWEYRLLFQIELARNNRHLSPQDYKQLLNIELILPNLLDIDIKPVLLHGDLWSGNIISAENHPYFIDNASYYGHCEIDFALTFMFGGFNQDFYNSYQTISPFADGFEKRKHLYMLYHTLNHLNLFGSGYHASTMNCVKSLFLD